MACTCPFNAAAVTFNGVGVGGGAARRRSPDGVADGAREGVAVAREGGVGHRGGTDVPEARGTGRDANARVVGAGGPVGRGARGSDDR